MLILSRQRDEDVVIGDDIIITVLEIRGGKVRLGITAPRHVSVHRREVYEQIERRRHADTPRSPETGEECRSPTATEPQGPAQTRPS